MNPKQPKPFDPQKAAMLDDPGRERWLPSAALVSLLEPPEDGLILDYGTGTARYAIQIAIHFPQLCVVAYDISNELLAIAAERVAEAEVKNVVLAGPGSAELQSQRFDRILAANVLHEIDLTDLHRIRSLLRTDGFALFVDWNADVPRDFGPPHEHVYTTAEACDRLACAGLSHEVVAEAAFPYHYVIRCSPRTS